MDGVGFCRTNDINEGKKQEDDTDEDTTEEGRRCAWVWSNALKDSARRGRGEARWRLTKVYTYIPLMSDTKRSTSSLTAMLGTSFKKTKQYPRLRSTRSTAMGL